MNELNLALDSLAIIIPLIFIVGYCAVLIRRDLNDVELQERIYRIQQERQHNKEFRIKHGRLFGKCACEECQKTRLESR